MTAQQLLQLELAVYGRSVHALCVPRYHVHGALPRVVTHRHTRLTSVALSIYYTYSDDGLVL